MTLPKVLIFTALPALLATGADKGIFDLPVTRVRMLRSQPGDLHIRHAGFDLEPVICDLAGHDSLCKLANYRQLVAEIGVLGLEPVGQRHCRISLRIGDDVAGVDIHHLR